MPTLTPISLARHGNRRWRRFSTYRFVQDLPLVPIVLGEHEQTAACLPILFARLGADRSLWPVALTRLGAHTALVAPNGMWRGAYVPSLLRVHPFAAQPTTDGQFALMIDEASDLISDDPADPAFFDGDGQIAPELAQVLAFFRGRAEAEARTRAAMAALADTALLTTFVPQDGISLPQDGLCGVDGAALAALGRVALADLHRSGALALVHSALVARHHMGFLRAAEAQPTAGPAHAAPAPNPELAGFFDAFASAQAQDIGIADFMRPRTAILTETRN